jgi:ArsR family transcriptional regulator
MCPNTNLQECCTPITEPGLTQSAAETLATRLKALSDPARLRLVSLIASNGEMCVCDLTEPLGLTQPTVSHHLKVLATAGLVHREQRGKWAYFSVDDSELRHVAHLLLGASLEVPTKASA